MNRLIALLTLLLCASCASQGIRALEAEWRNTAAELRSEAATGQSVVADRLDAMADKADQTAQVVEEQEAAAWSWAEIATAALLGAGGVVEASRRVTNANRDYRRRCGTDIKPGAPAVNQPASLG